MHGTGFGWPRKSCKGKAPTDAWWWTIVDTNSKERKGYPTQKTLGIINRIIRASSNPGDTVLDFFAGSGAVGDSCINLGKKSFFIDNNLETLQTMARRFQNNIDIYWNNYSPEE
ncbi:DNA methyltransferase [Leptolinea tardivitalis]|uniref:DNA methyltransferase n=1 Tax=Leptolinea tardivitalis TaxID=229920 RepID=UPI0009D72041